MSAPDADLTALYDAQYAAVRACYAAGLEPWTLRQTREPGRYALVRDGVVDGCYSERRAIERATRRNVWLVTHARRVARLTQGREAG